MQELAARVACDFHEWPIGTRITRRALT